MLTFSAKAQAYLDDIMLQSFGWDEQAQTRVTSEGGLYEFLRARSGVYGANGFDMIWMPPASVSTGGVGYIPTELFNFSQTSWGTETQLDNVLASLNANGIYPIADIVVNHRGGSTGWTDFKNPAWDCSSIAFNDDGGFLQTGAYTVTPTSCRPTGANDTGEDFSGARDLDHTNATVRADIKTFLSKLQAKGFKGWRWDVAKGFAPSIFGDYITTSAPYYSVGEYFDGNATLLKNWIDGTNVAAGNSGAFDFSNYYKQRDAILNNDPVFGGDYSALGIGSTMGGLAGMFGYASKAVTFVDNHDTFNSNTAKLTDTYIQQAYAYILTHPGIPCVFVPHYYGGTYLKDGVTRTYNDNSATINKLMTIRKANGINAYSSLTVVSTNPTYEAIIGGNVAMKIGPDSWSPSGSGWILQAFGDSWAVWSKTAINVPPTINVLPVGGSYELGTTKTVTMSSTDPESTTTKIYYTTDGSTPTAASTLYTGSFNVSSTTVIKAIAIDTNGTGKSSGVLERDYNFLATQTIDVWFKPPSTTPNWVSPLKVYIHFWNAQPTGNLAGSDWAVPVAMVADPAKPGYYKYSFPNVFSVNFLFRDGSSTGTLGTTKTADLFTTTDAVYDWDPTSSTFVKQVTLGVDDLNNSAKKVTFQLVENPVRNNTIKVDYTTENASKVTFNLYSIEGKLVDTYSTNSSAGRIEMPNKQKAGVYLLKMNADTNETSTKVIIK